MTGKSLDDIMDKEGGIETVCVQKMKCFTLLSMQQSQMMCACGISEGIQVKSECLERHLSGL